jgi:hypothetical protein
MPNSNQSERLAAKHAQNRQARLDGIKRWVEYIQANPPDVWGPQQNELVDTQLQSARETGLTADHERRISAFADRMTDDTPDDAPE